MCFLLTLSLARAGYSVWVLFCVAFLQSYNLLLMFFSRFIHRVHIYMYKMIYPETSKNRTSARAQHKFIAFQMAKKYFSFRSKSTKFSGHFSSVLDPWLDLAAAAAFFLLSFAFFGFCCALARSLCFCMCMRCSFTSPQFRLLILFIWFVLSILYICITIIIVFAFLFRHPKLLLSTWIVSCHISVNIIFGLKRHTFSADFYYIWYICIFSIWFWWLRLPKRPLVRHQFDAVLL